jgi:hypothetical protein
MLAEMGLMAHETLSRHRERTQGLKNTIERGDAESIHALKN